jgi:hypothetical protein
MSASNPRVGESFREGKHIRVVMGLPELRGPWVAYYSPRDLKRWQFNAVRLAVWQGWARGAETVVFVVASENPEYNPNQCGVIGGGLNPSKLRDFN